jgi:ribosomal protein S27E
MCFKDFFKGIKAAREVQKSDGLDGMMWCSKCKNTQPVYKDKFRNRRCFACHSPVSIDSKGAIDVSSTPHTN